MVSLPEMLNNNEGQHEISAVCGLSPLILDMLERWFARFHLKNVNSN